MRTQNAGGGMAHRSCKICPSSAPESAEWTVAYDWPARAGSVIVVEGYADASVGPVNVTPIGGERLPADRALAQPVLLIVAA